jgi:hypothetical protein
MAVTDAYATAAQYRAVTGKTDTGQDADILVDLKAISRYLDGKLGRFFTKDASALARVYTASESTSALWVDDMSAAPTSVKMDDDGDGVFETTLAATDYELLPLNAFKGPEPRPYTRIGLTSWGTRSAFVKDARVEVTAAFGWPSVPLAIQQATIHLTAILRLESPRATRRISELGEAIDASQDAQSIIRQLTDRYRRVRYI